jgi:hypothetical protein
MSWNMLVAAALCLSAAAVHGATNISISQQVYNMSVTGPANMLPVFVDMTPQPISDDHIADSCPDDIWENLINQSYPALP